MTYRWSRLLPAALAPALIVAALGAGTALAQSAAEVVDVRQGKMKELGGAFKAMSKYLKDGEGTPADMEKAAALVAAHAKDMAGWWPEGTAVGTGDSEAKPEIWAERAKFDAIIRDLETESAKLVTVAAGGDKAQFGPQFGAVGKSCKSCHEAYKAD